MSNGELPRDIPEKIAKSTDAPTDEPSPVNPADRVDPYRANRELERWLFSGMNQDNIPRSDQRATSDMYERAPSTPPMPADWEDGGEDFGMIVFTRKFDEAGNVIDITHRWEPSHKTQPEEPAPESDQ